MNAKSDHTQLNFRAVTVADRQAIQAIGLHSGRRNCNNTFANLIGWQTVLSTEISLLDDVFVTRYLFGRRHPAYIINAATVPDDALIMALRRRAKEEDGDGKLRLNAVEDAWAEVLKARYGATVSVEPLRDSYDYIYRREALEQLQGKELKAKRNHVNKFLSQHPDYHYRELVPDAFDACQKLTQQWREEVHHDNPWYGDTIASEHEMIERVFQHWDGLGMYGGVIIVEGRIVAFSCGAAVTDDTFDTIIEKADRNIDGAFNIINQQLAIHLPKQFRYINREEDMGLEGLRKSKLSYHPEALLSYNIVTFEAL